MRGRDDIPLLLWIEKKFQTGLLEIYLPMQLTDYPSYLLKLIFFSVLFHIFNIHKGFKLSYYSLNRLQIHYKV
jgi:hypothetical protein